MGMINLQDMGQRAAAVTTVLNRLTAEEKNKALSAAADALCSHSGDILAANAEDMDAARKNGMKEGLQDRLKLTEDRIRAMAEGLRQVAELPDCIGEVLEEFDRPNGMHLKKIRVPMGVIGIIYEARPNVTADAFGL